MPNIWKMFFSCLLAGLLLTGCADKDALGTHCECRIFESPTQSFQTYDVVFSGKVTEISFTNWYDYRAKFEVKDIWKGVDQTSITVSSTLFRTSCGYRLEEGKEYLVYAFWQRDELFVHHCSRTKPLAEAQQDLAELGRPKARYK